MPPTKTLPPRGCATCGRPLERKRYNERLEDFGVFRRRRFCDERCANSRPRERKSDPGKTTGHWHARNTKPAGACERCDNPTGLDVHHRDGDFTNNDPANLVRLCRSCHTKVHRYGHPL